MHGFYATQKTEPLTQSEIDESLVTLFKVSMLIHNLLREMGNNESSKHLKKIALKLIKIQAGLMNPIDIIVKPLAINELVPDGCLGVEITGNGNQFDLRMVNRARVQSTL